MANLVALAVARSVAGPTDVRSEGVAALPKPLIFYASSEVHSCIQKAVELLGHGARSLHKVSTDDHYRIDLAALAAAVAADRAAGLQPCAVIGSAGMVTLAACAIRDARLESAAVVLASQKLEQLRALEWNADDVNGGPAPGYSSGQAIAALEDLARRRPHRDGLLRHARRGAACQSEKQRALRRRGYTRV